MRSSSIIGILLVAPLVACVRPARDAQSDSHTGPPQSVPAPSAPARSATDSAQLVYWTFADSFPQRRQAIAKYGQPGKVLTEPIRNQFDSTLTDTIATLSYAGFSVRYYIRQADRGEFVTGLWATGPQLHLPLPAGIGSHRADLEHLFGPAPDAPQRGDTLFLSYTVTEADGTIRGGFSFTLVHGTVTQVEWMFRGD